MNMGHDGNGVFGLEGKVTPETLSTAHNWCDFCHLQEFAGDFDERFSCTFRNRIVKKNPTTAFCV